MPKLTPENVAEIIAERLGQVFSCSQFMTLFEDQALSSDGRWGTRSPFGIRSGI
jgi:hypothetical protein